MMFLIRDSNYERDFDMNIYRLTCTVKLLYSKTSKKVLLNYLSLEEGF